MKNEDKLLHKDMKLVHNWWFPAYEKHLIDNMTSVNRVLDGRLTYQLQKYLEAKPFVKNWNQVIDIGAHVGLWSWFMSKDFETVMAFEPMALHRECWARNMAATRNAACYGYALGEKEDLVEFETRTPDSSGDTQVIPDLKGKIIQKTLDSFGFADVGLIKIDCEGYEEFVLRGAVETLERCKPVVIVEQKRDMSGRYGLAKQSAVAFLENMGAVMRKEISGDYILSWD